MSAPLPSWNDGAARRALLDFVDAVTTDGASSFVRPEDRVAVFDNDGTLWSEQPMYVQAHFVVDRLRELAPAHPEWRKQQPFQALIEGDEEALRKLTEHDAAALIAATHAGMTTGEFSRTAKAWLATAKHPRFQRPFTHCIYQPMLELLDLLRTHGFDLHIVSGGGIDFLRAFSEETYGIPSSHVIGSSGKTHFDLRDGQPVLVKLPGLTSLDDGEGKPINIHLHIGKRPVLAFGNSDGDLQMLQYAGSGDGPRLRLLLHHDDAVREYAYDREAKTGRLDRALDVAGKDGWTVVSMRSDWNQVFPQG
ncbi:haloacid dehalogenase-like hydrolase [Myxococcus llanfairpwllgwyngyllgogerychwyrndrobwllllantysiliogogogochensis]|uniref:Haloacid dehalogenase-like hydrolase n=1 Tax=Myxococcus llanfairpwllgwyngyllgogerychwyrndrobwllllantysiliogogogochensis TaxID=2590453 RepID=A0A540X418_9BACT|nr:HAD family hydrolase [Myxococcus llanfairpwllgwyngyllgogerychwyrndrobwllllantysiliogogogochensis]TQF16001.1 haloacid dehalogenase-like hydrolase [Myxococcus llanfairpwllgwyngyllgogerychwyrndrobwllllantysiliogogogochensis]